MPKYIVFGGCLDSPIGFPQLPPAAQSAEATWVVTRSDELAEWPDLQYVGENQITSSAKARLYAGADGFRLSYEDSGTFDIARKGKSIAWTPGPNADEANVREDILGPVLAVAMHQAGRLCLHGSSVVLPGGAISFLAPKHYGKSTIAMATIAKGAQLLTDDSLPVQPGPPAMACPGVASVRFWDDTRSLFHEGGATIKGSGGKHAATDLADKAQLIHPQPLRAVYLLAPVEADAGRPAVTRTALGKVESALSLVQHAKIGAFLGKSEGPVMLGLATDIANTVPVYALRIQRDYDRLDEVVDQLFEWHANDHDAAAREPQA